MFAFFVGMMEFFHLIKVRVHNQQRLQEAHGGLILANHPTLIDVVITVAKLPDAICVVKGELFRNRYLGGVMRATGYISNDVGEQMLQEAQHHLAQNRCIVLFPEGSRSVPGKPLHFKRGTANIAVRMNAPILNIFITCTPITLTKGTPWWVVPDSRANIDLWVQPWAQTTDFSDNNNDAPAAARRFTQALQNYYEQGLQHVNN